MMKIAVTNENNQVFGHFGKCKSFALYETEGGEIVSKNLLDPGETGHGALAGFLKEHGAQLLICGGIGGGAREALSNAGISLIAGASGDTDEVVKAYLSGTLSDDPAARCTHHDHGEGHSCGGHEDGHTCGK